ncbi:hypothetical protein ABZX92_42135 [Lentzea sp. NPDC006480]|uniref:hypothetical protein n=1 Tax=Lentzea sp. NPDC006480 TaxID=3157176 RepID=UPI0033B4581B
MRAKRAIAVISALLGLVLTTAVPASASTNGTWVAYGNDNPITGSPAKWECAASVVIAENMLAQVCAIRSGGGTGTTVQGAVIVRNNRASVASASAAVSMWNPSWLQEWVCNASGVAPHSWSVCFTVSFLCREQVYASGDAKGKNLWRTDYI